MYRALFARVSENKVVSFRASNIYDLNRIARFTRNPPIVWDFSLTKKGVDTLKRWEVGKKLDMSYNDVGQNIRIYCGYPGAVPAYNRFGYEFYRAHSFTGGFDGNCVIERRF